MKVIIQVLSALVCIKTMANPYEACQAILKNGIHDEYSSNIKINRQNAEHLNFCAIAKKHNLNENNYTDFLIDFMRHASSQSSSQGASGGLSYGPFSLSGGYREEDQSGNNRASMYKKLMLRNKKFVLDYYHSNCGDKNYTEYLQGQAIEYTKTANSAVVNAWKECMINNSTDLYVFSHALANSDEISINVSWRSSHNLYIEKLSMSWDTDKITCIDAHPGKDLLEKNPLYNNSSHGALFKNQKAGAIINIYAITNTGGRLMKHVSIPKPKKEKQIHELRNRHCQEIRKRLYLDQEIPEELYMMGRKRNFVPELYKGKLTGAWIPCSDLKFS